MQVLKSILLEVVFFGPGCNFYVFANNYRGGLVVYTCNLKISRNRRQVIISF